MVETGRPVPSGSQGELDLGLPRQRSPQELAREELVRKANRVLLLYAERAIPLLYEAVRKGEGKQVITSTEEGRPGEELIGVDQTGETVLKGTIREAGLPAILISENTPEPLVFGNGAAERFFVYNDPFDNTSQYRRGLDTPPYTVASIWDQDGQPIGAVVGDIKDRKAYINIDGETFILDLETKDRKKITKSERTTLKDRNSTLATFLGEREYSSKFLESFGGLVHADDRDRKALL